MLDFRTEQRRSVLRCLWAQRRISAWPDSRAIAPPRSRLWYAHNKKRVEHINPGQHAHLRVAPSSAQALGGGL
jgi:hypothetical protein